MDFLRRFFGPPTPDRFAALVQEAFAEAGVPERFRYEPEPFRLISQDGHILNLHNFYDEYCRMNRAQRKEALHRWAMVQWETIGGIPDDVDQALPHLRPKLWMKWSIEQIRLQAQVRGEAASDQVVLPVGSHLCVGLVYDLPNAMASVSQEQLGKWGLSFYQALDAARTNLSRIPAAFASMGNSLHSAITGDNYDASRLTLLDRLREFEVDGDLIVGTPNRDSLLLTGSRDEAGLKIMFELTAQAMQNPRPMSPVPLRLVGDQWQDWSVPPSLPQYAAWRELQLQFLGGLYADQKEHLNPLLESQGADLFLATFSGLRKEGGEARSYCVWGDGVDALLPRTDLVALARDTQDHLLVPWDQLEAVVGDLLEPTDYYPARYRVTSFPAPDQWSRLRSFSLET